MRRLERKYAFYRKVAVFVAFNLIVQTLFPTVSLGLTSGPATPEFSSFEPVSTTSMVNPFTGDFTYNVPVLNIPGANGGGYAMSLSYHSGTTSEEESSWVGYGWTLNPGAINRGKAGYPDDWKAKDVKYHNKTVPVRTTTLGASAGFEIFSFDAGLNASLRYNNYKGFGYTAGASLGYAKGLATLGFNLTDGEGSFSLRVNPLALLKKTPEDCEVVNEKIEEIEDRRESGEISDKKANRLNRRAGNNYKRRNQTLSTFASNYGLATYTAEILPTNVVEYNGVSANVSVGFMPTPGTPLQLGNNISIFGSYAEQTNVPIQNHDAYGYMYSDGAYSDETAMMDYYVEKGGDYHKKDKYLGIPHNNADQYAVSGEGIGGGFRIHNLKAGHFRPNKIKSKTVIANLGIDIEAGTNIGTGADLGYGEHVLEIGHWDDYLPSNYDAKFRSGRENKFFRFSGDKGGYIAQTAQGDNPQKADLERTSGIPGFKVFKPDPSNIEDVTEANHNSLNRVGTSSYIAYNTNDEMNDVAGGVNYKAYAKNLDLDQLVDRSEGSIQNQIGEFCVTNENGERYTYGLPVYSRNEKNIQIDLNQLPSSNLDHFYRAYKDADIADGNVASALDVLQGEERNSPYATAHLLTSITESDYIDRTNDGPTPDDFGGYTKFVYNQSYGSNEISGNPNQGDKDQGGNWYKWRIPYTGLNFARNELSERKDDVGGFADGEKEVYYLDRIETKTHVAVFYTSPRLDGLGAEIDPSVASTDENAKGSQQLQKLDRIELFYRDQALEAYINSGYNPALKPTPLKTVSFGYDYSMVPGIPNTNGTGAETGKLTLKKVWFDFEGTFDAKISPYEFEYEYPDYTTYPSKYNSGPDDVSAVYQNFNSAEQNPSYGAFQLDGWGTYHGNGSGEARFDRMRDWLDQSLDIGDNILGPGGVPTGDLFDPAAWQLKVIKLPSGGEIHVQYEQDDYVYVQDKLAHVMVSLKGATGTNSVSSDLGSTPKYYLETNDLDLTAAETNDLEDLIQQVYVSGGEKIYFKFLYNMANGNLTPELDECNVEYIRGYVKVKSVGQDGNGLFITVEDNGARHDVPREVCEDFCKANRSGKFMIEDCYGSGQDAYSSGNIAQMFDQILDDVVSAGFNFPGACAACDAVNWSESYVRVPSVKAKKGGGLRVKRIMMYSPPVGSMGYAELYGSEYVYEFVDTDGKVKSSGVATTEPVAFREENVLVNNIDRLPQNAWDKFQDKIIAGRDSKQFEGPLGENLYGAPSVGYSKVIIKNIHSGKTNTGYTLNEYLTCKDFPVRMEHTNLASSTKRDYLPLPGGLINKFTNNVWTSQGYSFKLNAMHGQPKRVATYSADYTVVHSTSKSHLVSAQEYEYFGFNESLPVMNELDVLEMMSLGKETDICFESRYVKDKLIDGSVEFDVDVGLLLIPLPFGSFMPSMTWNESEMYTHVSNKVVRYPAITKSARTYRDGIWRQTDYLAFASRTGKPVVSRTYDDFNSSTASNHDLSIDGAAHKGWLTAYKIPSYTEYVNMDQTSLNERKVIVSSSSTGLVIDKVHDPSAQQTYLNLTITGTGGCSLLDVLEPGALVKLSSGSNDLYHVSGILGTQVLLEPTYYSNYGSTGTDFSASSVNIEIVRSGRTNMVATQVGSFVTYGEVGDGANPFQPQMTVVDLNDPSHPDHAQYLARLAFANSLNSVIPSGGSIIIPPNLLEDPNSPGDCWTGGGSVTITPSKLGFQVSVDGVGTTTTTDRFFPELKTSGYVQHTGKDFAAVRNASVGSSFGVSSGITAISTVAAPSISRTFMDFNTSSIPNSATITGATLGIAYSAPTNINVSPQKSVHNSALSVNDFGAFTGGSYGNALLPGGFGVVPITLGGSAVSDVDPTGMTKVCVREFDYDYSATIPLNLALTARIFFTGTEVGPSYLDVTYETENQCISTLFETLPGAGVFEVDPATGALIYNTSGAGCQGQELPCLKFCDDIFPITTIDNVVTAGAITLSDIWNYDEADYNYANSNNNNDYELAKRGKWRAQSTYSYREATTGLDDAFNPFTISSSDPVFNYNSGLFQMKLFNWKYPSANDDNLWLKKNTITRYSPNGNSIEERNIIGISSAAKFGYNRTVPYLSAGNAEYDAVTFESFENEYVSGAITYFEDGVLKVGGTTITGTESHTGRQSLEVNATSGSTLFFSSKDMVFSPQVQREGLHSKVWVKGLFDNDALEVHFVDNATSAFESGQMVKVAQVGEWTLYELDYSSWSGTFNPQDIHVEFYVVGSTAHTIHADDIRIQPVEAEMMCYVYDVQTLKLVATMDDQHFSMIYVYDGEGKLTRKLIETERGMRTVAETEYNQPTKAKNSVLNGLSN